MTRVYGELVCLHVACMASQLPYVTQVNMEFLVNPNCIWEATMVFFANMDLTNCICKDPMEFLAKLDTTNYFW